MKPKFSMREEDKINLLVKNIDDLHTNYELNSQQVYNKTCALLDEYFGRKQRFKSLADSNYAGG